MADDNRRDRAKQLYESDGLTQIAIATRLGVSRRTVERWAAADGWGARRVARSVVPIEEGKKPRNASERPFRKRARNPGERLDELEIIDTAIDALDAIFGGLAGSEAVFVDVRGIGSTAGALVKLLEFRRKIQPPTAADLAEQLLELGISPADFVAELKVRWRDRA